MTMSMYEPSRRWSCTASCARRQRRSSNDDHQRIAKLRLPKLLAHIARPQLHVQLETSSSHRQMRRRQDIWRARQSSQPSARSCTGQAGGTASVLILVVAGGQDIGIPRRDMSRRKARTGIEADRIERSAHLSLELRVASAGSRCLRWSFRMFDVVVAQPIEGSSVPKVVLSSRPHLGVEGCVPDACMSHVADNCCRLDYCFSTGAAGVWCVQGLIKNTFFISPWCVRGNPNI